MKINTLEISNFKKFEKAQFNFNPNFNVLIGDNGSGKTSILDALAVMLCTYLLKADVKTGRKGIENDEVRVLLFEKEGQGFLEPQEPVYIKANGTVNGSEIEWKREHKDRGGKAHNLTDISKEIFLAVSKGEDVSLPVILYYGTGRLWDRPRTVNVEKPGSRLIGYRNCLDPRYTESIFMSWMKKHELAALQKKKRIPVLEAVRGAVINCIPDAQNFYYDVTLDKLIIEFENGRTDLFNNLSDGYRNMTSIVADVAHRAARLNPHLGKEAPSKSNGIILIDEIDLHLHPKWQRRIISDLKRVFPEIQFIVTTHSPFIIQSLSPGEAMDLENVNSTIKEPSAFAIPSPPAEYSNRSIEDITEEIMNVETPQRSKKFQDMYNAAKEYYKVLEGTRKASPEEKQKLKDELDRLSAPYSDNVAYMAFLEMERAAAGMGKGESC